MKTIYFIEAIKNIKKNFLTSVLLVMCFVCLFCLFSWVSVNSFLAGYANTQADTMSVMEYTQIEMGSMTSYSPRIIWSDLDTRSDEVILAAGRTMEKIMDGMTDKFGAYQALDIFTMNSDSDPYAENRYACPDMYKINASTMIFKEGGFFEPSDFLAETQDRPDWIAPVILGAKFAEKYELSMGDIFYPDMFVTEDSSVWRQWQVIGILEYDSSYFSSFEMKNLNYKVLCPNPTLPTIDEKIEQNGGETNADVMRFIIGDLFMKFRNTDYYISKDRVEDALDFCNEIIAADEFLAAYYLALESPDRTTYLAEQQTKAKNYYVTVAVITYIITGFGIIMSVSNKIQNNMHNYSIHALSGATVFDLIMCSITEIFLLLLTADILFQIPYFSFFHRVTMGDGIYIGRDSPMFILFVNIITVVISAIVSFFVLRKFNIVEHMKRKE